MVDRRLPVGDAIVLEPAFELVRREDALSIRGYNHWPRVVVAPGAESCRCGGCGWGRVELEVGGPSTEVVGEQEELCLAYCLVGDLGEVQSHAVPH